MLVGAASSRAFTAYIHGIAGPDQLKGKGIVVVAAGRSLTNKSIRKNK
jgi:hypothetical protein